MSTQTEIPDRATPLIAFAKIPWYWEPWLKGYWWGLKRLKGALRTAPGKLVIPRIPGLRDADALVALSFITFARWSTWRKRTIFGDEEKYLLFETNFNGDHDAYLEAFSVVVPLSMKLTWKLGPLGGYGIPNVSGTSEFLRYIGDNEIPRRQIYGIYNAHPHGSVKMIQAALALRPKVEAFDSEFRDEIPANFERGFRDLLAAVQHIRDPRVELEKTTTGSLCVLAPVLADDVKFQIKLDALSFNTAEHIPQDRTHSARWALVEPPDFSKDNKDPTRYLLFTAWFDHSKGMEPEAAQREYATALHRTLAGRESVWQHCGFRNTADPELFWNDLRDHRVGLGIPFYGYEGTAVSDVDDALDLATAFWDFCADAQDLRGPDLKDSWEATFPLPEPDTGGLPTPGARART
jgi:hypothetical protein